MGHKLSWTIAGLSIWGTALGCSSSDANTNLGAESCAIGAEGCDCTQHGGCDKGLSCQSRKCVSLGADPGGSSSSGGKASTGAGGATGQTGGAATAGGGAALSAGGTPGAAGSPSYGGTSSGTGASPATGGTAQSTGGTAAGTGGTASTGGSHATGGTVGTGGVSGTGGAATNPITAGCKSCFNMGANCGEFSSTCSGNVTCAACLNAPSTVGCSGNKQFASLGSCACEACAEQCGTACSGVWAVK